MEWVAIVGAALGKIMGKKVLVKDSTMNGLTKIGFMPVGKLFQRLVINNCNFIAMTKEIENNYLKLKVSQNRIYKIPNGVKIPRVVNQKWENEYKCLFVGNLYQQPAKGVDILLQSWVQVLKEFPESVLDIVGDGDINMYEEVTRKLNINNSVKLWGKQEDTEIFYLNSNLFVLPSRREGMSNALLEAMSYSLPCIATDISGSQDLIEHMCDGIIVPVEDINNLALAIIWVFNNYNQAKQFGEKASKKIRENYSLESISKKYQGLYRNSIASM